METKERVERLLKNYKVMKRNLENLKLEYQRHFLGPNYNEVIEGLTFSVPEGERVQNNSVSDITGRIALSYRGIAESENAEILRGLRERIYNQKNELDTLENRINLLEPKLSEVIRDMYILNFTWEELCKNL